MEAADVQDGQSADQTDLADVLFSEGELALSREDDVDLDADLESSIRKDYGKTQMGQDIL